MAANQLAHRLIDFPASIRFLEVLMDVNSKRAERKPLVLPGRVTWKDSRGTTRFASVMTRDISATGVFIEWGESTSIPMYRLVSFQIERDVRNLVGIPSALQAGRVLSAVYRLGAFQRSTGTPEGYGLRMLIEPAGCTESPAESVQATA
jgi:hypothetical protein